jgi:hypothetical protein
MATSTSPSKHHWRFFRAGGVDQVRLDTADDILNLGSLDQKLWVALSCPVKGLEFDERTLALLDSDKDGRVRVPEILNAIAWLSKVLKRKAALVEKRRDGITLEDIDASTPEGARVHASAKHVLASLKKGDGVITVADATATGKIIEQAQFNGDGIVAPASIADAAVRKVAEEIVSTTGGARDRSGAQGYDAKTLAHFYAELAAYDAWQAAAEKDAATILPFGAQTGAAAAAVAAVRAKVDDYFARCQMVAFDKRAQAALNREESEFLALAAKDLSISAQEISGFPLAAVEAEKPLPLGSGVNPAWSCAIAALKKDAVAVFLGKDASTLSHADWTALKAKLAAHDAWAAAKSGATVAGLGKERVRALLAGKERAALDAAIATDLAAAAEVGAIEDVERLARYVRDLHVLLRNFVNFSDFYSREKAIFQVGTLYFDARSLDLCVSVNDAGKHATLAPMSKSYLAYVDCKRPGAAPMQVAAAFTAGDSDNLFVGRNGLFYDRAGRDWDATISKIVDNPISLGQAFWSPYKKLLRWIEETIAKRAAASDEAANAKLQASAANAGSAAAAGGAPAAGAPPKKMDIGVLAAISVAISGVAVVVGQIMSAFFGLGALMPLGLLGLVLLISGPSMVIAWLKLRQRNLGPILDANGWAVNALTKVNIPLGRSLTDTRAFPPGSERSLVDPYAPKKSPWPKVIVVLLVLSGLVYGLWHFGHLHTWWPDCPLPKPASLEEGAATDAGAGAAGEAAPAETGG